MDFLTTAMSTCTTIMGNVFTIISENTVASIFLGFAVLGGGVGLWRKIKRA